MAREHMYKMEYIYMFPIVHVVTEAWTSIKLPVKIFWSSNCHKTVGIGQLAEYPYFIIAFELGTDRHNQLYLLS